MRRWLLVLVLLGAMVLAGCGGKTDTTQESPLAPGIANPASQYCKEQGYTVEIRTAADGSQTGYCIFPDGTECEEWAFQRGECQPGTPKP